MTGDVIVIESDSSEPGQSRLVDCVPADDLAEAKRRLAIIKPLVRSARRTDADVRKVAAEQGVSRATVYGWLNAYEGRRLLTDLAPRRRGRAMPKRLAAATEAVAFSFKWDSGPLHQL